MKKAYVILLAILGMSSMPARRMSGPLTIIRVAPGEYTQLMIRSDGQGGTQTNTVGLMGSGGIGTQGIFNPVATGATMVFCISNLHGGGFIDNTGTVWFMGEADNNPYITGNSIYSATIDSAGGALTGGFSTLATGWQSAEAPSAWYYGIRNADSTLWACGDLQHGMRGIHGAVGATGLKWVPVPLPNGEKAKSIMGSIDLIILTWSGHVYVIGNSNQFQSNLGWGSPTFAQSASSYSSNYDQPNELQYSSSSLAHIRMIAGGGDLNWAVDSSNNFYTWGQYGWRLGHSNSVGADQLNNPTLMNSFLSPYFSLSLIDTVVTDGACQHILLTNGTVYGWGSTEQGTVGNGQQINYLTTTPPYFNGGGNEGAGASVVFNPVQIAPGKSNFVTLYNGIYYNYYDEAMDANGVLIGWGRNKGCALQTKTVAADTAATQIEATYPDSWNRPDPTYLFNADTVTQVWRSTSPTCFNSCPGGPTTGAPCSNVTPACYTDHAHLVLTSSGLTINASAITSTTTGFLPYVTFTVTSTPAGATYTRGVPDNPVTMADTIQVSVPGTYTVKVVIFDPNWGGDSTTATITVGGQTGFYVSSSTGSDAKAGTQASPFATYAHALAQCSAADTIYLKRGDVFNACAYTISYLTVEPYGSGADPVISGFTSLSTWTNMGNGIYEAFLPNDRVTLNCVTIDGNLAGMGRYPDTGYVTYSSLTSTTLTSSAISIFPYLFNNGTVAIRDEFSVIDTVHVNAVGSNTLTLASSPSVLGGRGNGFFMMNHPNTLRTTLRIGSWYNNVPVDSIQMFFGNAGPSGLTIQIATLDTLSYCSGDSSVAFHQIDFEGSNQFSAFQNNTYKISYDSCIFRYAGNNIVRANNASHSSFLGDTLKYANNNGGYNTGTSPYLVLKGCLLDSCGMTAGMGQSGTSSTYEGWAWGNQFGQLLQYNSFFNSGYNGLYFSGDSANILNNFGMNYCMVKCDGAFIYTWDPSLGSYTYGRNVIGNIGIIGGNPGGGIVYDQTDISFSIYLDNYASKVTVSGNAGAFNVSAGGFNHGANNTIIGNNWFGNSYAQFLMAEVSSHAITGTIYKDNVHGYMPTSPYSLVFTTPNNDLSTFCSACDSNYYLTQINVNTGLYTKSSVDAGTNRTLASWQSNLGIDAHSHLNQAAPLRLVYSLTGASQSIYGYHQDIFGNLYSGSITLNPYQSLILQRMSLPTGSVIQGSQIIFH